MKEKKKEIQNQRITWNIKLYLHTNKKCNTQSHLQFQSISEYRICCGERALQYVTRNGRFDPLTYRKFNLILSLLIRMDELKKKNNDFLILFIHSKIVINRFHLSIARKNEINLNIFIQIHKQLFVCAMSFR